MRRFACFCYTAAFVGCATSGDQAATDTAAASAAAPQPLSLADVAGRWKMRAMNAAGDSLTAYDLVATPDRSGWTLTFPTRAPMPLRVVAVKGDSIVTEAGPYPSMLREGVGVRSLVAVNRLEGGRLVGTFVARYETTRPDSVLYGRVEGTRAP